MTEFENADNGTAKRRKKKIELQSIKKPTSIRISALNLADFSTKADSAKINFVRRLKLDTENPKGYDYWKKLKDTIRKLHQGLITLEDFILLPETVKLKDKVNYQNSVKDYLEFITNKELSYFKPLTSVWVQDKVSIKISPDLGLVYNDQKYVVMLYIRMEPLIQRKADLILTLAKNGLKNADNHCKYWLLDVMAKNLFTDSDIDPNTLFIIKQEILKFESIWNKLK
jgi:hypothetical protein